MKKKENPGPYNDLLSLILLLCAALMLMSSCRTPSPLPVPPRLHDSVRIEIRERVVPIHDTLIHRIPQQTASQSTRDSLSRLETDFAESCARIEPDGTLYHTLTNKPQDYKAPVDTFYTTRDSMVYRDRDVPVPTPYPVEKELSQWQKLKMEVGGIVIILFILWGIYKIYKIWKQL